MSDEDDDAILSELIGIPVIKGKPVEGSMRPPKPRRPNPTRVANMIIPSGPMTVMPGSQCHPTSSAKISCPITKLPGAIHSAMTVMPGMARPLSTVTPAAFFAGAAAPSAESKMWEDQRRRDAIQAAVTSDTMAVDEVQEVCGTATAFIDKASPSLPAATAAELRELSKSVSSIPKLMEALLSLLMAGQLDHLYSENTVFDSALELVEQLVAHRLLTIHVMCFFERLVSHDQCTPALAVNLVDRRPLPEQLLSALASDEVPEENVRQAVRSALLAVYRKYPPLRNAIYTHALRDLRAFGFGQTTCYAPIHDLLQLLLPIISGLRTPIARHYESLLCDVIAPLHSPGFMLDELTPVLQTYHKPLSLCTRLFMRKLEPERHFRLASTFVKRVLNCWQPTNTKHTVLLLNAMQDILDEIDGEVFDSMHPQIVKLLADSSSSEHAAVAQRALQLWRSEAFVCLMRRQAEAIIPAFIPALIREGNVHWNDGVNHLIGVVLDILETLTDNSAQLLRDAACQYLVQNGICRSHNAAPSTFNSFVSAVRQRQEHRRQAEQECTELKQQRAKEHRRRLLPDTAKGHLNFVWGRDLGYGSYSVVRYAKFIEREVPQSLWLDFAVKVMNKEHIRQQNYEAQVLQEIEVLKSLDHPSISCLFAHFEDANHIYAVLDYCCHGDIFSLIFESGSAVNVEWFKFCIAEVSCSLHYLHGLGYYYGDLKPENILLAESGHICLCDFGSCKSAEQLLNINTLLTTAPNAREVIWQHISGTAEYLAPEIITAQRVSPAADWWALGCLAFQLLAGHLPFFAEAREELFHKVTQRDFHFPITVDKPAREIIDGLLAVNPDTRLNHDALRCHSFFTGIDFDTPFGHPSPPALNLKRSSSDEVDAKWKRRKFSMMWNPIPNATSSESLQATLLDAIPEVDADCMHWEYYGVRP